jgi:hypothetical protein
LIRETTENESANEGYRFGQEEETYNIVAAHGYFACVPTRVSKISLFSGEKIKQKNSVRREIYILGSVVKSFGI